MPQSKLGGNNQVPLTLLKRSNLPPTTRGAAGIDSVAISDGGQFRISTTLSKKIGNATHFATGWGDREKRQYCIIVSEETVGKAIKKGEDPKEYMGTFSRGKQGDMLPYFAGVGILRADAPDYDYKGSGNQVFPASWNEKLGVISFTLPSGKLEARPSTGAGRKKGSKNKANGAAEAPKPVGVAAEAGSSSGVAVNQGGEPAGTGSEGGINLEEAE